MSLLGGKGGLLDALAESDELYQRLLGLKQKYAQAAQELGPHSASLRTKGEMPFAFNNASNIEAAGAGLAELGKPNNQAKTRGTKRNVRMRSRSDSACMFINGIQLLGLMRKLMAQIGSCHVDTVLEYLRRHWDLVRGGDLIPYNIGECRKHVMQQLRSNTAIFVRDPENEGCWTLSRDEDSESSEIKYYEPQIDCIMRAMEENETGQYSLDYIAAYVIKNWARRHPMSDAEIKESVKLTLMTNPRFHYDIELPGGLVSLRSRKQNQAWAAATKKQRAMNEEEEESTAGNGSSTEPRLSKAVKREESEGAGAMPPPLSPASNSTTLLMAPPPPPGGGPASPTTASGSSPATSPSSASSSTFIFNGGFTTETKASTVANDPNGKSRKRSRAMSPPAGYACACGTTYAGKAAACKWRKGANGEFLCNACGLRSAKKAKVEKTRRDAKRLVSVSGEGKRDRKKAIKRESEKETAQQQQSHHRGDEDEEEVEAEEDEDEDDDDDDDEEDSPWICCDNCGQWVLAKDDNIDDVSIYDDSNPNHLDYFCPQCREQAGIDTDGGSASGGEEGATTAVVTVKETVTTTTTTSDGQQEAPSLEEERWTFGEDNEGEESGFTSSETTPHLNTANGGASSSAFTMSSTTTTTTTTSRKRGRTASLFNAEAGPKRKVRPRTRSQQVSPISADIMGETVAVGGEGKLEAAEHKIRLEWERTVSHQEGEEVDPEVAELEERVWNDIQKYKSLLTQTRDSLWSKNLVDYKKKKEKLKREREKLDAKAESDLMRQFMEYFKKKKRKLVDERENLVAQRTHNPS